MVGDRLMETLPKGWQAGSKTHNRPDVDYLLPVQDRGEYVVHDCVENCEEHE